MVDIFKQIETTADYYSPADYVRALTSDGNSDGYLTTIEASDFIPLTSVKSGTNVLMMVVGIIPPTANITGRLLDRSASVANIDQNAIANSDEVVADNSVPSDWQEKGSKAAAKSKQEEQKRAGTPLKSTETGKALTAAQQAYQTALVDAIARMQQTPPLRMLVNPNQLGTKHEKKVSDGDSGRYGAIVEHWGDNQVQISLGGKLAAFYAQSRSNANGPGLTRTARQYSLSWQNFQALYHIYRSNGKVFLPDPIGLGSLNIAMMGSIYIYYDSTLYIGSFNSFTLTESEAMPFSAEYNIEFVVNAMFELDRTDSRFTYGAGRFFRSSAAPTQTRDLFNTPQ